MRCLRGQDFIIFIFCRSFSVFFFFFYSIATASCLVREERTDALCRYGDGGRKPGRMPSQVSLAVMTEG